MEDVSNRASAPARRPRLAIRPRDGWFLALAVVIVALDQFTKWLIGNWLELGGAWPNYDWPVRLVHITNSGAAFGMLQGAGALLVITSLIGMSAIIVYLFNPGFAHPLMRGGLALMLGGAVGNLIDRVANGEVVDFIQFPEFPAFNVADSSITIGVLLLLWGMLREPPKTGTTESS